MGYELRGLIRLVNVCPVTPACTSLGWACGTTADPE
jgi:hypothetical protein